MSFSATYFAHLQLFLNELTNCSQQTIVLFSHYKRFIFLMGKSTSSQQGNALADIPKLM